VVRAVEDDGRVVRARHHLGHDVVNREQGIEGGAKLDRPIQPDEIAIPHLVSDT